ncbi:AarF/UbiB family protein [Rickettsiales bacterium]|nr:AarF/UbiB family protein [Rickettsiales bacterium]
MILFIKSILNIVKLFIYFVIFLIFFPFYEEKAIYLFLKFAGPVFVKLGQFLSVRPDLVGEELAELLSKFQDNFKPFSSKKAVDSIENIYKKDINDIFKKFKNDPVASASVAQTHKAVLKNGDLVAVKLLRPNIDKIIKRDLLTIKIITFFIGIFSKNIRKMRRDIIKPLEHMLEKEVNLLLEAASSSKVRDILSDFDDFVIPKIYWEFSKKNIIVMQWIEGTRFSNKKAIEKTVFDKKLLAKTLVLGFFHQAYDRGFFHADMHPGNLILTIDGKIALIDFGIIGVLEKKIRIAITQIFINFMKKDYKKVAELHLEAGLIPKNIDIDEFALYLRILGETVTDKKVSEVPLILIFTKLIEMINKYNMKSNENLLLLQKTITLIEGVALSLDKDINIWDIARPWMEEWSKTNISFDAKIRDGFLEFANDIKIIANKITQS